MLVDLAVYAATVTEWLWDGFGLGSMMAPDFEKKRDVHREMLRQVARKRETWPVEYHCRKAKRKMTEEMVKQLKLGTATPLKAVGVKDDHMRHLIEILSYEIGIPTVENYKEWPEKAIQWIAASHWPAWALSDPKGFLYFHADPERQKGKRQTVAYRRLDKWEAKARREHKSGALSPEEDEVRKRRLRMIRDNENVTDAEIRNGLKEAFAARLKSIVEMHPQI